MTVVVDASLIIRALTHAPNSDTLIRRIAAPEQLHAPQLIDAEVVSGLRGHLLGRKVDMERARQMYTDYLALPINRHDMAEHGHRILELRHNLTAYDASYVVLAERLGCPLFTADAKFAGSTGHDVEIRYRGRDENELVVTGSGLPVPIRTAAVGPPCVVLRENRRLWSRTPASSYALRRHPARRTATIRPASSRP